MEEGKVQEFALDSKDGRALAAQLGEKPAAATSLFWVPEDALSGVQLVVFTDHGDKLSDAFKKPGIDVYDITYASAGRAEPDEAGDVILVLTKDSYQPRLLTSPIVQFETEQDLGHLVPDHLRPIVGNPALRGQVIYWAPTFAQPVELNSRKGYAFYASQV